MKFLQHEHPTILDAKPGSPGFVIGKNWNDENMIAAIPVAGSRHQLAIIHHGSVVKYCKNFSSAKTFINKTMKKKIF